MVLYVKFMVSNCCKLMVKDELKKLGHKCISIELGEVEIKEELTQQEIDEVKYSFKRIGLELMDDQKAFLVEKIKNTIIEMVHNSEEKPKINFSEYLSETLNYEYPFLTNLFSEIAGTTIENYVIINRIERVKEYLIYDELTITEIAYKLNYSSVAHLSTQFKKVTGLTPTFFKALKEKKRTVLENL